VDVNAFLARINRATSAARFLDERADGGDAAPDGGTGGDAGDGGIKRGSGNDGGDAGREGGSDAVAG
jgi:hypothetical protein